LDANVIISGLLWKGTPRRLLEQGRKSKIALVTSEYVLLEVREVLEDMEFDRRKVDASVLYLRSFMEMVRISKTEVQRYWDVLDDKTDVPVLAAAIRAKAVLVTGDKELLEKAGEYIEVVTVRKALNGR
jgi:putative PIN family toxin of toxin-antitoxin system